MLLKRLLEELYSSRKVQFLDNDPVLFCHRFKDPRDQEIVGLIASCFAYGTVATIKSSVESIVSEMTPSPLRFIESYHAEHFPVSLKNFKHRFNSAPDVAALFQAIKHMLSEAGSLQAFFLKRNSAESNDYAAMMNAVVYDIMRFDYSEIFCQEDIPKTSSFPFLFPAPSSGSACKRFCMFLRWMIRPADGIDLGLWHDLEPSKLTIPVDAHIQRICQYLGLTARKTADWKMAREITMALQQFDSSDPVKYDFSLCHLGISEGCTGKRQVTGCEDCLLVDVCTGGLPRA